MRPDWSGYISLRINTRQVDQVLSYIENTWAEVIPFRPFRHVFLDEDYNRQYLAETRMSKVVTLFTVLAIFIACIGLFGLTTFTIERRNKEIAVRKVLGASISQVILLLSKDFAGPILLSIFFAGPLAFWLGNKWLSNFAYQIDISLVWFVLAAALLTVLAGLALGFQAFRAALVNPVTWLKEE